MESSYLQNHMDEVIRVNVLTFKPILCVELGVLQGCSTLAIAKGIQYNKEHGHANGHLHSYDLWEDYEYKHSSMETVQNLLNENKLSEYVTLYKEDAFKVHEKYSNDSVTFLHIDISNDGDKLEKLLEQWHKKMRIGGIIVMEGGSNERDKIEWMIKYNKRPIRPFIESNKILNNNFVYATYEKFPSITVALKKWDNV
jgi:hypothetical protein